MKMHKIPNVVYIEDDPQSREIMELLLVEEMGVSQFTILEDSQNFLSKIEDLPTGPDVFLLDIHIKPHSGFEMLKMLRQHHRFYDTPVVALTASVMNEEVEQLHHAGFNGIIAKPVDLETFPDKIWRVLNGETVWAIQ